MNKEHAKRLVAAAIEQVSLVEDFFQREMEPEQSTTTLAEFETSDASLANAIAAKAHLEMIRARYT